MPSHKPKERIITVSFRDLSLRLCTKMTHRDAVNEINSSLHRCQGKEVKLKTYMDFCKREGNALENGIKCHSSKILTNTGFDPKTGKPVGEISEKYKSTSSCYQDISVIQSAAEKYNSLHTESDEKIPPVKESEYEAESESVYVSVDDVGVKHQKEHRNPEYEKDTVYVQNTVSVIESAQYSHVLTNVGQHTTICNTLAELIEHDLLNNKHLIFLTDGAKDIRKNINEVFGFRPYTIILDWYHLKKKCQEYLSMSVKGGKEMRNIILQKLLRILWAGNVDNAEKYLNGLTDKELRTQNKIRELCAYFEKNRDYIPCYALRDMLSLKNSSNRVEKANDLVVAKRQKHNGMSWSSLGSGAIAQIQAYFINCQNSAA